MNAPAAPVLAKDDEPCDVCGLSPLVSCFEVSLCGVIDGRVHRCASCGFRQIRPRLTRLELGALYPDAYFDPASPIGFEDYARQYQRNRRAAYFLARDIASDASVLEVGSALGFLLYWLRRYRGCVVRGVDVSEFGARFARDEFGVETTCGTLEESVFGDAQFDVVIARDLLEHVTHPRRLLEECARILKPGGRLVMVTPNGEANLRPLQDLLKQETARGGNRLPVITQGHLSFFSRDHLLRLANENGLQCVRFRNVGVTRGLRALGVLPRKKRKMRMAQRAGRSIELHGARRDADPEAYETLRRHVREQITKSEGRMRGSRFYFAQRRFAERLDSLPARFTIGVDFEITLQKP